MTRLRALTSPFALLARPKASSNKQQPILALALACFAPASELRFDISAKPFVDMHFYVRMLGASKEPVPDVPGLAEAVEAARALDAELGSPLAWGYLEGLIGDCATAKEGIAAFASARETVEVRPGTSVALRAGAVKLAAALEKAEPAFLELVWPEHKAAIDEASSRIAEGFGGKEGECLEFVAKHLGPASTDAPIPVRLVYQAPFPGAVTHRSQSGQGVCFVAVKDSEGTQLLESILHEATHALDVATPGGSVLQDLRSRLEKAGMSRSDKAWRDVPHTLMFVQAGETIRRIVDPEHEHYGVVAGYYDKVRSIADLELPVWTAHLDGKTTREEAIQSIVDAVIAAKPR